METPKLNIYQKLLTIQKEVMGLGKDKDGYGYKYVTGSKVLEHIKPLMNKHSLILKQEVISIENTRQDHQTKQGAKSEILTKVMMRFTWVDCESGEKDENLFAANGQNDWEKGLGSALTYGERYFFLKYFHIATDEDDIDNPDRQTTGPVAKKVEPAKVAPVVKKAPATPSQVSEITELLKSDLIDDDTKIKIHSWLQSDKANIDTTQSTIAKLKAIVSPVTEAAL